MSLAERVVVLNFGRILADGAPRRRCATPAVVEAYLGDTARRSVDARASRRPSVRRLPRRGRRPRAPPSPSPTARPSRSSAPTAPGRRRCSARCAACSGRRDGAVTFDGPSDHRPAGPRHRPARPRLRPGRAAPVPRDDGAPRTSTSAPSPRPDRRRRTRAGVRAVPPARRAPAPARRDAERRRAADARRRPGADVRAQAADARRADDGSGARSWPAEAYAALARCASTG